MKIARIHLLGGGGGGGGVQLWYWNSAISMDWTETDGCSKYQDVSSSTWCMQPLVTARHIKILIFAWLGREIADLQ